ncbi:MYG1 family protein [Dyadobacter sp. CY345]|uniref:MYG1 family protein n=1 Tax=Dyadobacter sp. CY345 TaxID=2909335 RepID=UPI001F44232A|nr:MYG1 family protein [Dyadobacter sp. CY345]MCF2447723.1 MYG1 family protein [Dyadobacter sp. CY345]
MQFSKVITHDTAFHADEVMAVALLRHAGFQFKVIRSRNPTLLADSLADPEVVVLDVGGIYDPLMLNFDHHQDASMMSAAGLIYDHFKNSICPKEAQPFFGNFIASIDAIDTNRDNIFAVWNTLPMGFRNTSSIIGGFNREINDPAIQDEQFQKAVDFTMEIIKNEVHKAVKKAKSEADYSKRTILANNVAVFDEFSTVWKEKDEHTFAMLPHANGWQIQSVDTTVAKVPENIADCEGFVFRHASGFMAVVKDKNVALEFAKTL